MGDGGVSERRETGKGKKKKHDGGVRERREAREGRQKE